MTAAIGGLKIPHSHSNLRSFCWLHTKTGPSKVEGVNMPSGPWPTSGCLTMGVAGRTCLANLHGHSIETWPNYFRWNLSSRRSVSTFRDLEMPQLHILLLVAKTPLRHLYLREHSFGHYLRFMTIAEARNKDQYKN